MGRVVCDSYLVLWGILHNRIRIGGLLMMMYGEIARELSNMEGEVRVVRQ